MLFGSMRVLCKASIDQLLVNGVERLLLSSVGG